MYAKIKRLTRISLGNAGFGMVRQLQSVLVTVRVCVCVFRLVGQGKIGHLVDTLPSDVRLYRQSTQRMLGRFH